MTSQRTRRAAVEQFGAAYLEMAAVVDGLRDDLPPPRDLGSLVEEASPLGFGPGRVVVDVGAGRGRWSKSLVARYGCACIAVDISHVVLQEARTVGLPATVADVDVLPFADDAIDGVWCRDMLEMVDDPVVALRECARVLRPGGGMLLYVPFMTERMEPLERAELVALNVTSWWGRGREPIDQAIGQVGFDVLSFGTTSPEYTESSLLHDPEKVREQLIEHAQLRRGREEMEPTVGTEWYQRFLAWSRWQMYLLLGKLENGLWLLRKPDNRY